MSKRTRALQIEAKRSGGYISIGDRHIVVGNHFVSTRPRIESASLSNRVNSPFGYSYTTKAMRRDAMSASRNWREACALSRPRLP